MRQTLGELPSPLWGGVGGGGQCWRTRGAQQQRPPSPTLPQAKSGLPDFASQSDRSRINPTSMGGGRTSSLRLTVSSISRNMLSVPDVLQEPFGRNLPAEAGAPGELVDLAGDREELRALQVAALRIGDLLAAGAALDPALRQVGERHAPARGRGPVGVAGAA